MVKWYSTKFPGVRYREHPTRKNGVQKDRYYVVRFTVNGKRYEEALGWASEGWSPQEAAEELGRLKKAQRTGEGAYTLAERREQERARREAKEERRRQEEIDAITISQFFFQNYLPQNEGNKTRRTINTERGYFQNWIEPTIGDKPMKQIAPLDLERISKAMRDKGKSPQTIQHVLKIVRQVLNRARAHGLYQGANPVQEVKKPKADNRRLRFLSEDEAEQLLEALAERSKDVHDMALMALHCGLRAGEIFSLAWSDIDFRQQIVTIRDTKNGRVRHVPMTDRVREMLREREMTRKRENGLVFPAREGGKRQSVGHTFDRTVNALGMNRGIKDRRQRVVFHSLRHTAASWLVMAGVPLYTVKEFLGHQSISLTERYAHLAPDSLQQATNVLNGIGRESQGDSKAANLDHSSK